MKAILSVVVGLMIFAVPMAKAGVGVHGGINLASLSTSPVAVKSSSTELMLGVFYESKGDMFHFQPEFNYVRKYGANYLAVPLLGKLKFDIPVVKPFLVLGPALALRVEGTGSKTFEITADGGGGVEIEIAPAIAVVADIRYSLGLTDTNDTGGIATIKSRGVHILAGLHFAL